jgi:hypothetical protein
VTLAPEVLEELNHAVDRHESCPEILGSFLTKLVNGGTIKSVLHEIVARVVEKPSSANLLTVGNNFLLLAATPAYTLHLRVVDGETPLLYSSSADAFLCCPEKSPLALDVYRIEGEPDLAHFRENVPLRLVESGSCAGRLVRQRKADPLVYDFRSPCPAVLLKLTLLPPAELVWVFDRAGLASSYSMLSRVSMSGLVMLCKMIGAVRERRAIPWLVELARHPSHVVRWSAIQAIGRLDRTLAVEHLLDARADEHPSIRESAALVVARLGLRDGSELQHHAD